MDFDPDAFRPGPGPGEGPPSDEGPGGWRGHEPAGGGMWEQWSVLRILLLILALGAVNFAGQLLAFAVAGGLFLPVIIGSAATLAALLLLFRNHGFSLAGDLRLGPVPPGVLVVSLLMSAAAIAPSSLLAELSLRLHPADPQWVKFYADNLQGTPRQIVLAMIGGVLLAPLVEEIIFRGLLQRLVARAWGPWPGIVISALVFAIIHGEPWFLFGLIAVGLVLGYLFEATGSLGACWAAHALHNAVSMVILFMRQDMSLQPSELGLADWLLAAGSLGALLAFGSWLAQRQADGRKG